MVWAGAVGEGRPAGQVPADKAAAVGRGRSGGSWGAAPGRPPPSLAPVPPDQARRSLAARTAGTRRFPPPLKLACSTSWGVTCRGCSGAGREP